MLLTREKPSNRVFRFPCCCFHDICGGLRAYESKPLTRPQGHEIRIVLFGSCLSNVACESVLDGIGWYIPIVHRHLLHKVSLNATCRFTGVSFGDGSLLLCSMLQCFFITRMCTAFPGSRETQSPFEHRQHPA